MERKNKPVRAVAASMKRNAAKPSEKRAYDGIVANMVTTGSTLLDLAISGGRVRGGGMPTGILVEVFGPSGSGKTVILSEIAGAIQRKGGQVMFHDPEARLNKQFARMFDLNTDDMEYSNPDTVPEVFQAVRNWEPAGKELHGVFADSLAALSTNLEMTNEDGDKMGMRRAKEFSEELRKTCRIIAKKNLLMVCSNQVRESGETYGPKYHSPGGLAIGFYSSLRLRAGNPTKIKKVIKQAGKEVTRVIGVQTEFEVFKSSVWKPHRTAPVTILFDYGIDDIRENLQFLKTYTKSTQYVLGGEVLSKAMEEAIQMVEADRKLILQLKNEVIDLWEDIESKFESDRKPKIR